MTIEDRNAKPHELAELAVLARFRYDRLLFFGIGGEKRLQQMRQCQKLTDPHLRRAAVSTDV